MSDPSPQYRDSLLFLEAHLRRTVPTDASLAVGLGTTLECGIL